MDEAGRPHELYWKEQLVGIITEVSFSDFPWLSGRFEPRSMSKPLQEVLDWCAAQAEADELQDPPFESDLMEAWVIVKPDGSRHELILPPLIDFTEGLAEWR